MGRAGAEQGRTWPPPTLPEPASDALKTVVVLCKSRAICPRGKMEILLPEGAALEFESACKSVTKGVADWCAKLIAEDDGDGGIAMAMMMTMKRTHMTMTTKIVTTSTRSFRMTISEKIRGRAKRGRRI